MRREKKFRVLYPTQIISLSFLPLDFFYENIFLFEGKKQRGFFQRFLHNSAQKEHLHTHKRPSVSSPKEKMEQQLLLAGRRHASFLCSSSSLSLSKKLKKNIRGGGGGALFSRFIFLTDNFSKPSDPFFSLLNLAKTVVFLLRLINYQEETEC